MKDASKDLGNQFAEIAAQSRPAGRDPFPGPTPLPPTDDSPEPWDEILVPEINYPEPWDEPSVPDTLDEALAAHSAEDQRQEREESFWTWLREVARNKNTFEEQVIDLGWVTHQLTWEHPLPASVTLMLANGLLHLGGTFRGQDRDRIVQATTMLGITANTTLELLPPNLHDVDSYELSNMLAVLAIMLLTVGLAQNEGQSAGFQLPPF